MFFGNNEIVLATHGEWLLPPGCEGVEDVLDDSRKVGKGSLFVAVVGELADGHNYLRQAAEAGAAAVCVQRRPDDSIMDLLQEKKCGCLLVKDGLLAFQSLANANRMRYPDLPVLAVTGSCGKTSTKEMCAAVLEARWPGRVVKTIGNTNNHFGVPRNLLRIDETTGAAVIEAGSNHPGEIASLGKIIMPSSAVISCIGAAHLEFFHDLQGVAEEKGDIFEASSTEGVAIIPADCAGRDLLVKHAGKRRIISFGLCENADVRAFYGGQTGNGYELTLLRKDTGESITFEWAIGSECQAGNAAAAAAAGIAFGLELKEIAAGLQKCRLPGARMSQSEVNGVHWVNDAYNANPDSMLASLKWFKEISRNAPRRLIVIGDMRELGESEGKAHEQILAEAVKLFPDDTIVTVGTVFAPYAEKLSIEHYSDVEAASTMKIEVGTWVFLKASYGTGLYKLAQ